MSIILHELSYEERKLVYKGIIRYHKDNGTFKEFSKNDTAKSFLLGCHPISYKTPLYEFLVTPLWLVYKRALDIDSELEKNILASIFFIKFIDMMYGKGYDMLDKACEEIAYSEFFYIESEIGEHIDKEGIPADLKNKLNEAYKKYSTILSYRRFTYLPLD